MQLLMQLLRHRVTSPISYQSLAKDVQVSTTTIKKYIQILEALFIVFRVTPYSRNIARSLLKHCYAKEDYQAEPCKLHYIKTKEKKEIDFALVKNGHVEQLIEAKLANQKPSKSLIYFEKRYHHPNMQIVKTLTTPHKQGNITLRGSDYLRELFM